MPYHHRGARRRERTERRQDVLDERPPGELVEHLGPRRPHAGPEPGGEHDDGERAVRRHGGASYHMARPFAAGWFEDAPILAHYRSTGTAVMKHSRGLWVVVAIAA